MNQNERREYLRSLDLEMSKQNEKIIKDSQPKPKPDVSVKLLKPIKIDNDLITGTPQYKAEKQISDVLLSQQIENTVKLAMYAVEGKTPAPSKSSVTDEMIDDYKKEIMKPVEIMGQKFLYHPVDMPPIPGAFVPKGLSNPFISEEDYKLERANVLEFITEHQARLEELELEEKGLGEQFRNGGNPGFYDEQGRRDRLRQPDIDDDDLKNIIRNGLMGALPRKVNTNNLIDRIIDIEKGQMTKSSISDIRRDLKAVKNAIRTEIIDIKRAEAHYRNIEGEYNTQLKEMEVDRLNEIEYNNQKRQLTEQILNDFNQLNQGKIKVSREPQETDDDFYTRLQSLGAIPVDQKDIDAQVQTDIFMKAKKNILELTSDLSKAETVVKMLNNDERFQMNKTFPRIKKKYSETFGLNNKNLDANEITQFISNELETGQSLITPKASIDTQTEPEAQEAQRAISKVETKVSITALKSYTKMLIKRSPELNLKILRTKSELINQLVDKQLWDEKDINDYADYLRNHPEVRQVIDAQIAQPINTPYLTQDDQQQIMTPLARQKVDPRFETTRGETPPQSKYPPPRRPPMIGPPPKRFPPTPPPGPPPGHPLPPTTDRVLRSYTNPRLNNAVTLKRVTGPNDDEEQDWGDEPDPPKPAPPGIVDNNPLGDGGDDALKQTKDRENVSFERAFNGSGLKNHVLPSTVAFGKIALDLNKLFYQNVLSIKRPNGNKIIGHKNKRVSDNFVEIILKMFENKPITQSDLKNIKDEIMLYDNLIVQSGLHKSKKIPTNIEQTSEQMKNRLGLITGEIEAGNSNKKLLSELHELLFKMVRVHLISKNAATAYYKNMKTQFFDL